VIANDTDLESLPKAISPAVRQTLMLCLQKDVRKRVADIRDVRLALEGAFETVSPRAAEAAAVAQPIWRRPLPVAAAAVLVTGLVVGLGVWVATQPEPRPVNRFDYDIPEDQALRNTGRPVMALSPDGRQFVYNVVSGLYLRTLGELEARLIPGTEPVLASPSFSPDGQAMVYWDAGSSQIKRIAISGGAPVKIADVASNLYGVSWEADGTILIGQPEGILRVPATGGTPELIIPTEGGIQVYGPRLLPDGDSLLFSVGPATDADAAQIVVQSLSTGERTVLVEGGYDARYVHTGHLIYALEDGLFAVAFDPDTLIVSGGAVPLVQGVMRAGATRAANYGVSEDGTLVYVSGSVAEGGRTLVWVDREGRQEPINVPSRNYIFAQLSPDGTRVALADFDEETDTWIWDLERETLQRLTFDPEFNVAPIWSLDGQRVAFSQMVDGTMEIYWQAADGSGSPQALTEGSAVDMIPTDLSPDGTALLYMSNDDPVDIWVVPVEGPATAGVQLLAGPADERSASVSPDGQWLAYQSDESGQTEIYVRPFPEVDTGRWQISTGGGSSPLWSRDGSELFYFVVSPGPGDALMAVSVESEPRFRPGAPEMLFQGNFPAPAARGPFYDVSLDGQQFLMITFAGAVSQDESAKIIIVENWLEELKRLAPIPE
jgi:serine/threonine-protein kinase